MPIFDSFGIRFGLKSLDRNLNENIVRVLDLAIFSDAQIKQTFL